jgi:hypothetical protein
MRLEYADEFGRIIGPEYDADLYDLATIYCEERDKNPSLSLDKMGETIREWTYASPNPYSLWPTKPGAQQVPTNKTENEVAHQLSL